MSLCVVMPLSRQGTTVACRQGGQEGKVELWEEAEKVLDRMAADAEGQGCVFNEGALCALVNAYNLCIEERRQATDLFELHKTWSRRTIGVVEPK
jgi:hypothetical protein